MSDYNDNGDNDNGGEDTLPDGEALAPYEVGYGKPPKDGQFPPGVSGNPYGRPRGSRNKPKVSTEIPLSSLILEEAGRTITAPDGRTLTIEQALIRSVNASALKGGASAQKHSLNLIKAAREEAEKDAEELREASRQFKAWWATYCQKVRREEPHLDISPDPNDVRLDPVTGFVIWDSPWVKEMGRRYSLVREVHGQVLKGLTTADFSCPADNPGHNEWRLENWRREEEYFHRLNERLEREHRKKIPDRVTRGLKEMALNVERRRLFDSIIKFGNRPRPG